MEELKINKKPNITRPDLPDYVGPDEGKADLTWAPWDYALGAYAGGKPFMKSFGAANTIDAGLRLVFPEAAEDTPLERKLEIVKPVKTAVKSYRIFKDIITDIFDNRIPKSEVPQVGINLTESRKRHPSITRLSTLKKQAKNRRILDQTSIDDGYVEEIIEHGDDVIYPEGSIEADIQANTQVLGAERTGKSQKLTIEQKLAQRKSIFEGAAITNVEELDRTAAALVQRRGGTLSGTEFKKWNKEATADLQQTYKHITDGELNAHHNNIVKSGVSLHEGRTGPESSLIESWLINRGVASGDSPLNNNLIPEQVHGLVHKWLNERIGKQYLTGLIGELNSPLRKRWESLPIDHPDVRRVVEQYADYVNGATERTAELMQAYYQIWGPQSKITADTLETLYNRLGINKLEYDQLIKPGLSGKDARAFAQGYGPKKVKITWNDSDRTTETIYERLQTELSKDSKLEAQIDALNRPQVKVGDFSNEPTSPTPAQIRRQGWAKEIEDLEYEKKVGKLSKAEKKRLEELRELFNYGEGGLPLLRGLKYGGGPFKGYTKTLESQTTKIKGTGRVEQKSLFDQINDILRD